MGINKYKKASEFFKAFSHPTRVMIVEELMKGRMCVNDIKELVKLRQPNISQHLTLLKLSGIVDWKQEGKTRCYFLKAPERIRKMFMALGMRGFIDREGKANLYDAECGR